MHSAPAGPLWVNLDGSRMFATRPLHLRLRPVGRLRPGTLRVQAFPLRFVTGEAHLTAQM